MLFYIFFILLFISLYALADRQNKPFLLIIALIPPVLIEGCRELSIGTDMYTYVVPYYETLRRARDVFHVPELINLSDYGYLYLTYFVGKYLGNIHLFLIICAIIKLAPVYYFAYKERRNIDSVLFISAYYFYYYVLGFSMMRQGIAISICFLALHFFFRKKYLLYAIWTVIAYFMHNSALLMFFLPIVLFIGKFRLRYIISIFIPVAIFINIEVIMTALISSPLFTEGKVEHYIDSGVESEKTSILIALAFTCFGILMLFLKHKKYSDIIFILLSKAAYTLIFLFLATYIEVAFRMSYYMMNVLMLSVLYIIHREKNFIIYKCGVFAVFLLHFIIACTHGLNDTIPYKSEILFFLS